MTIDASKAYVYTDLNGLAELRAAARENSPDALRETAKQFEGLFLQMMMKSMRQATPQAGLFNSDQTQFYQQMFDNQIALHLAKGRGLGLSDVIYRQLGGKPETVEATGGADKSLVLDLVQRRVPARAVRAPAPAVVQAPKPAPPEAALKAEATMPAIAIAADWSPATQADYVGEVWPHAVRAGRALGVAPEVLVAQSALETGWGQKVIRHADGRPSFNLFGIKADHRWDGDRVTVGTLEYVDGVARRERAQFRAYDSPGQSFDDYVNFLQSNPRYRHALERAGEPEAFVRGLQEAGYATDPSYADKILSIMSGRTLSGALAQLKDSARAPIA